MTAPPTDPPGLVALMMAETKPQEFQHWGSWLMLYARRLSEIAPKLTEDELWRFIGLGAAIYQRGYREFEAGVIGGELLDQMRKSARED